MTVRDLVEPENRNALGQFVLTPGRQRRGFIRNVFWTRKSSGAGALIVLVLIVCALAAPVLATFDPSAQDLGNRYAAPSRQHLMGTDSFGRDILSRSIWGARISLLVGVAVVLIAAVVGGALGIGA